MDKDYFSVPEVEIEKIRSMLTIVDGKIVHESAGIRAGVSSMRGVRSDLLPIRARTTKRGLAGGQVLIESGEQRGFGCMLAHHLYEVDQVLLPENLYHAPISLRIYSVFGEELAAKFDQACVFFL